ncbi:putative glyoxalase superfamily protein PhnB [Streptosporangium album]|uniref:Putative glyoxalase superfamily protein PhnB n=1 Tax=Streptosporangium album TaxID=47479 RepID=A0A7W7RYA6_9ACTN|nr:VOC family protein [Streptosporangium album]MBB4940162.1 putative glyoxalase superfamily protein PhnB [Streptosporangium album]
MSTPLVVPFLRYQDAPAAIEWLGKVFGFQVALTVPGPRGGIGYARLALGDAVIMLASVRDGEPYLRSALDLPAVSQGVFVVVEDLDAHYEHAGAMGAEIVVEPEATPEGARAYLAFDLEGQLWAFGDGFAVNA